MYVYKYIYMYMNRNTCIFTYISIYTNIYIYIYIYSGLLIFGKNKKPGYLDTNFIFLYITIFFNC